MKQLCVSVFSTHRLTQAELSVSVSKCICQIHLQLSCTASQCVCGLGKYASNHIDAQFLNTKCRLQTEKENENE